MDPRIVASIYIYGERYLQYAVSDSRAARLPNVIDTFITPDYLHFCN